MTLGFSLWACNQAAWTYLRDRAASARSPIPYFFDIVLFFHAVPMIAAVAWRPDLLKKEGKIHLSLLNFLMLLGWWIFLYAFIVFPHQYVVAECRLCTTSTTTASTGWRMSCSLAVLGARRLDQFRRMAPPLPAFSWPSAALYGINSQLLDRAVADGTYYSGSLYDVPLIGAVAWMAAAALSAPRMGSARAIAPS